MRSKLKTWKLLSATFAGALILTLTVGALPVFQVYDFYQYIRVSYIYAMDPALGFYIGDPSNLIPVKAGKIDGRDLAVDGVKLDSLTTGADMAKTTYDTEDDGKISASAGGTNVDSSAATGFAYVTAGAWSFLTPALNSLSDVTITTPAQGDLMQYDGSTWVNFVPGAAGTYLKSQGAGAALLWGTPSGAGDMAKSTYDPANVAEQLVGLTAAQVLANKIHTLPQINDSALNHQYLFAVADLTANRTINLPLLTGNDTFVFAGFPATLTNKTLTSPVINSPTGIVATDVGLGNVDNTSDATKNTATATLTNKTLTSPIINVGSDADGDMYVRVSGQLVRIPKGTNGYMFEQGASIPSWIAFPGLIDPMTTRGDLIIRDSTNTTARYGIGSDGTVLSSDGTDIAWNMMGIDDTTWTGANWTSLTNGISADKLETVLKDGAVRYSDRASQLTASDVDKILVVGLTSGTVYSSDFTDTFPDDVTLNNYTVRVIVPSSEFSIEGDSFKITLETGVGGATIENCYIGNRGVGASDFDGNQVQVYFGGNSGIYIGSSSSTQSDATILSTYDDTKDIVVSYYVQVGTHRMGRYDGSVCDIYYVSSAHAGDDILTSPAVSPTDNWGLAAVSMAPFQGEFVVDDSKISDYLPLIGGTLTGGLITENLFIGDNAISTGGGGALYKTGSNLALRPNSGSALLLQSRTAGEVNTTELFVSTDGIKLKNGTQYVNEIETTLTDDDTHLPTSGAVVDYAVDIARLETTLTDDDAKVPTSGAVVDAITALAMASDTTLNFTTADSRGDIQADIQAIPKNLGAKTLILQFADGTYTHSTYLYLNGFFNGKIYINGNPGEAENTLHTNQAVIFDASTTLSSGFLYIFDNTAAIYIRNIKFDFESGSSSTALRGISNSFVSVKGCYFLGDDATSGYGIRISYTAQIYTRANYFSNMQYGYGLITMCMGISEGNDDTGTQPQYGLSANGSVIMKSGTQITGSVSDEVTNAGGEIR